MACASDSDNVFGPRINPECRPFDFTLLFEDGFFGLLPAALFLVLVPHRLQVLRSSQVKLNSFQLALVKLILLIVLLVLHILYTALRVEDPDLHTRVGLASGVVNIIATGAAILLSFLEDQRSIKPSDLLVVYYSTEVLLSLPQLRSLWQIPTASVACTIDTGRAREGLGSKDWQTSVTPFDFLCLSENVLSGFVPRICLTAFSFCQPFLITATIDYVQNDKTSESKRRGQAIVGAYVLVYLGWAISTAVYWRQTNRFNTKVRSGLIAMVFNQTSRLKASDINDSAAITLMGTDVERIVQSQKTIHETWATILEVGIAIWLLERQLLIACVVPAIIAIGSVLAIGPISNRSGQSQKQWVECVQARVTGTSNMLRDIKSIKMLGLSRVMFQKVSNLRKIELKTSERFRKLLIWEIVISNVPTDFAPFATFAIYTIIAVATHHKTLLSSQAFTSLSLISLVTNPLLTFIQSVPAVRQAMACYLRIEEYCKKQTELHNTRTGSPAPSATNDGIAVELQSVQPKSESETTSFSFERADIAWSDTSENKLHDITLRVGSGITMLIGPVGSGKSTLLSSLLGETVVSSGDVRVADSQLAYCFQVSWILDDTVRQNIILGSLFNSKWYEVATWACGLKDELSNMSGGDLYRAGANGLSLSGGQKQRIALCRAIYSRK
ncbi:hypothetical protein CBS76997_10948 [Aspergillus niger]|nr:hypothetical protein CBS13152_3211 [Aspergillus niger]KAI3034900.1 hypothetical protein CBS76997_10948 [Aspergillus niger]